MANNQVKNKREELRVNELPTEVLGENEVTEIAKAVADDEIEDALANYVKKTDYAADGVAGVIKAKASLATQCSPSGNFGGIVQTYDEFTSESTNSIALVSKGTLINFINREVVDGLAYKLLHTYPVGSTVTDIVFTRTGENAYSVSGTVTEPTT